MTIGNWPLAIDNFLLLKCQNIMANGQRPIVNGQPEVRNSLSLPRKKHQGFTLLEVIVALAIFSVIGLGSWQVLNRVLTTNDQLAKSSDALADLQRGMWILARDLQNVAQRPIRNEYGTTEPAITTLEPGYRLILTRNGWSNPLKMARGPLQRVAYSLDYTTTEYPAYNSADTDNRNVMSLIRTWWPVLDRTHATEPVVQELIPGVEYLEIEFVDHKFIPRSHWPVAGKDDNADEMPAAIIIRLGTQQFGEIERIFHVSELGRGT